MEQLSRTMFRHEQHPFYMREVTLNLCRLMTRQNYTARLGKINEAQQREGGVCSFEGQCLCTRWGLWGFDEQGQMTSQGNRIGIKSTRKEKAKAEKQLHRNP